MAELNHSEASQVGSLGITDRCTQMPMLEDYRHIRPNRVEAEDFQNSDGDTSRDRTLRGLNPSPEREAR